MSTQPVQKQPQQIPVIVVKGQEVQQLQGIVDNMPTKYGRILDAFFSAVGKRRQEEAAQQAELLKLKENLGSTKATETATGINGGEQKVSEKAEAKESEA